MINKVTDILLDFSGSHRDKLDPRSIDAYRENLKRVFRAAATTDPIEIVLPGFPFKSPNRKTKVLGKLPDLGELTALKTLDRLVKTLTAACDRPFKMVICSDGFAFNDLKGIPDEDVIAYRTYLRHMIGYHFNTIAVKGLDDFLPDSPRENHRDILTKDFGRPVADVKADLATDSSLAILHRNLTAFAWHDLDRKDGESRKKFRARCKDIALNVVARSGAWANLVENFHPDAIRLSIHPYTDVSKKFPVELVPSADGRWRTPWHNVSVRFPFSANDDIRLMPKKAAEENHYDMEYKNGRAWNYMYLPV